MQAAATSKTCGCMISTPCSGPRPKRPAPSSSSSRTPQWQQQQAAMGRSAPRCWAAAAAPCRRLLGTLLRLGGSACWCLGATPRCLDASEWLGGSLGVAFGCCLLLAGWFRRRARRFSTVCLVAIECAGTRSACTAKPNRQPPIHQTRLAAATGEGPQGAPGGAAAGPGHHGVDRPGHLRRGALLQGRAHGACADPLTCYYSCPPSIHQSPTPAHHFSQRLPQPLNPPPSKPKATLIGEKLYLFGGEDVNRRPLSDLHVLDLPSLTWSVVDVPGKPQSKPAPRCGHAAVVCHDKLIVFGGVCGWGGGLRMCGTGELVWRGTRVSGATACDKAQLPPASNSVQTFN